MFISSILIKFPLKINHYLSGGSGPGKDCPSRDYFHPEIHYNIVTSSTNIDSLNNNTMYDRSSFLLDIIYAIK